MQTHNLDILDDTKEGRVASLTLPRGPFQISHLVHGDTKEDESGSNQFALCQKFYLDVHEKGWSFCSQVFFKIMFHFFIPIQNNYVLLLS